MKVTSIKQQVKQADRYSVFVDEKYAFSLSENALLESKITRGQELTAAEVSDYKKLSDEDKLYGRALKFIAMRPRTQWEIENYLKRKKSAPEFISKTIEKLTKIGLIDDEKLAGAFVADRRLLKPTSKRKLTAELRKKRVPDEIIEKVLSRQTDTEEINTLRQVIAQKRQQAKYQNNLKLMQYLSRQGFNYDDIKQALSEE